jgi:hypothetical protein
MLHDKPTRDTIRNRRAGNYRALESEDEDATEEVEVVQDDKIDRTGWMALTWSFTISAGFTVESISSHPRISTDAQERSC